MNADALLHALRHFRQMLDGCTKPVPEGRQVVHPMPLREAAEDLANAAGAAFRGQWAEHGTIQRDGVHSTGQMAIGRGRGADSVAMAAVVDAVSIVQYLPGERPTERWAEGHVFDASTLAALDRALALTATAADGQADANPNAEGFAFRDEHLTLLVELAGRKRLVKATELDGLSGMPPIDRMRDLLRELESAGYVHRPSGTRSGFAILPAGRDALACRNMLPG